MRREALSEDCRAAAVVISFYDAPLGCANNAVVIDRAALDVFGAHALYLENETFRVATAYPAVHRPFMPPVRE